MGMSGFAVLPFPALETLGCSGTVVGHPGSVTNVLTSAMAGVQDVHQGAGNVINGWSSAGCLHGMGGCRSALLPGPLVASSIASTGRWVWYAATHCSWMWRAPHHSSWAPVDEMMRVRESS